MKAKEVVEKLRGLPEWKRQSILWGVTGILGILLLAWWIADIKNIIDNQSPSLNEQLQLQSLQEDLENIPTINGDGRQ
jgi:hypothetical protein